MVNNKSLWSRETKILTVITVPQLLKQQYINTEYNVTTTDTIFANNQFDAQFFSLYLFIPILYYFEQPSAHHRESQLYQSNLWYMSLSVGEVSTHHPNTQWHIPEVVLIQLTLPMMSTWLLETCREFSTCFEQPSATPT